MGRIAGHKNRKSFFVMELPEYKAPSLKRVAISMLQRGWAYIVKAGIIICLSNAFIGTLAVCYSFAVNGDLETVGSGKCAG